MDLQKKSFIELAENSPPQSSICSYAPANGDTTLFEKHMKSILSKIDAPEKEVILIGDQIFLILIKIKEFKVLLI